MEGSSQVIVPGGVGVVGSISTHIYIHTISYIHAYESLPSIELELVKDVKQADAG